MLNSNLYKDSYKETYLLEGLRASDKSQTCHMVQVGPRASCQELGSFGTIYILFIIATVHLKLHTMWIVSLIFSIQCNIAYGRFMGK